MNIKEYEKRVKHNTKVAKAAINSNGINGLFNILDQIYTVEGKPGDYHITTLIRGGYDLIPAILLGYLPSLEINGADAIEIKDGDMIEIEFKWSTFRSTSLWMTEKGTIYAGLENTNSRRVSLRSMVCGAYVITTEDLVHSKKRKTILLVSDAANPHNLIIDAFELDPKTVYEYLTGWTNRGEVKTNRSRTIKLNTFMKKGKSVKHNIFCDDGKRMEDYENLLRKTLPTFEEWQAQQ